MFSNRFSTPAATSQTWSTPWSMRRSSGFIAMAKAQKGDFKPGHRQVSRRADDQDPGPHRCPGQSGRLHPNARSTLRYGGGRAADRRRPVRRPSGRQGLRFERDHRRTEQARGESRGLPASKAHNRSSSTPKSTNGATWSRTSSANSESSSASPCAPTKPIKASPQ